MLDTAISVVSDLIIILFDLLLYMQLTRLKKETRLYYGLMYGGSALIVAAYVVAVYVLGVPYSAASFLCMTIPSLLLFLSLSKYKSARFLVTFCFVDTVTFIIASVGKVILVAGGTVSGLLSCTALLTLCMLTLWIGWPYFPGYRDLLDRISKGWVPMAVCTVFIYSMLVVFTVYPRPLLTRMEYLPVYFALCITVLSFYCVFILLLTQKAKLTRANQQLQLQQHWHDPAYMDELTHLANPAAYVARTAEIEEQEVHEVPYSVMSFDMDHFKQINDDHGHHMGNLLLRRMADFFQSSFPREHYEFFRVGGDEFAAIVTGVPHSMVEAEAAQFNSMVLDEDLNCTCSCSWAPVDFSRKRPFDEAFVHADRRMYAVKREKKAGK